jgi:nucleoside-triphosphatase
VDEGTPRLLLEGRPGIGKTTVARRLHLLQEAGVSVGGFTTGELRTGGRREGFLVEAVSGAQEVLAHVDLPGPPRVGRYGVDLAAFDRVALSALRTPRTGGVVVVMVDELGKMELASAPFRDAVMQLLDCNVAVVATAWLSGDRGLNTSTQAVLAVEHVTVQAPLRSCAVGCACPVHVPVRTRVQPGE